MSSTTRLFAACAIAALATATTTPATAQNFLKYVDAGHYNGGTWHRTVKMDNQPESAVKIEVIQAGVNPEFAKSGFAAIALERTSVTGISHKDGVISMARGAPDSATSTSATCRPVPPTNTTSGCGNAASASGARPATGRTFGTPNASQFACRSARSPGSGSIA